MPAARAPYYSEAVKGHVRPPFSLKCQILLEKEGSLAIVQIYGPALVYRILVTIVTFTQSSGGLVRGSSQQPLRQILVSSHFAVEESEAQRDDLLSWL